MGSYFLVIVGNWVHFSKDYCGSFALFHSNSQVCLLTHLPIYIGCIVNLQIYTERSKKQSKKKEKPSLMTATFSVSLLCFRVKNKNPHMENSLFLSYMNKAGYTANK